MGKTELRLITRCAGLKANSEDEEEEEDDVLDRPASSATVTRERWNITEKV